ncbi:MAG: glycosyltransferase family 2 protein [Candidatus Shapirobacteria bacterium]
MNMISIVIPNLNGEEFLPACLESLKSAIDQAKIKVEIILVDNASSDASPEIFTTFCQKNEIKYQLLSLNKNYGFAGAVNRGVEVAKSDWVLVCNNDLKIDKNWFIHTSQLLNYSSTKLATITGTVLNYDGSRFESQGLKFHYSGKCDNINNGKPFSTTSLKDYSPSQLIWGASAALTLYNRKIFTKLGGFDEDFFAYEEDVDLSLRLHNLGYKTLYVPQALSYHLGGATSYRMGNFRHRMDAKNWIYIILKNYSTFNLLIYSPFILIERLRNFSGLIKNTPLKDIPRDVFKTYGEVIKNFKKMIKKRKNI